MNKVYCCFPGGKHKALTMSYDDGRTQDRRLVEIFNRWGIRSTFHLNSGFLGDDRHIQPDEVRTLYAGHEVACHTVTHPTITRCPLPSVAREVLDDRQALEALTGYPVRGLSYPNGSVSDGIEALLPACGIRYSRVVGNSDGFALPENPYRWQATWPAAARWRPGPRRAPAIRPAPTPVPAGRRSAFPPQRSAPAFEAP